MNKLPDYGKACQNVGCRLQAVKLVRLASGMKQWRCESHAKKMGGKVGNLKNK